MTFYQSMFHRISERTSESLWVVNENNNEVAFLKSASILNGLTVTKSNVYFIKDNWQLWKTDGTVNGTIPLPVVHLAFG